MTSKRFRPAVAPTPAFTITVAVMQSAAGSLAPLHERLTTLSDPDVGWRVEVATEATLEPAVVLAGGAGLIRTALRRWPTAAVIGLVPADDDGTASLIAMEAGATVCVRGTDPGLVAAYIRSVARRRGLLGLAVAI